MRKTPIIAALSILAASATLAGCGDKKEYTGQFIDSPVSGLNYKTDTLDRITNDEGKFTYRRQETVTFSIGSFALGRSDVKGIITPIDLAGKNADYTTNQVINTARLLQTIDSDGSLTNGIQIDEATRNESGRLSGVDLTMDPALFEANGQVLDFINNVTAHASVLVAKELAIQNLKNGIAGANAVGALDAKVHAGSDQTKRISAIQSTDIDLQGSVDADIATPTPTVQWSFAKGYPSPGDQIRADIISGDQLTNAILRIQPGAPSSQVIIRVTLKITTSDGRTGSNTTQITICPTSSFGNSGC